MEEFVYKSKKIILDISNNGIELPLNQIKEKYEIEEVGLIFITSKINYPASEK